MEEVYDALVDLKRSIDKQNELQEETNAILRALIGTLQESGKATADLTELLQKKGSEEPKLDVNAMIG
ncbi:MAG: hypothetical protein M9932_18205 [Xanthobacteraceae bacterium]|nr:hypothetical protein [Xanthobacteraceae bacterium]